MKPAAPSLPAEGDGLAPPAAVDVVPVGDVDELAGAVLSAHLRTVMNLPARVLPPVALMDQAWLPARSQHDAAVVLDHLHEGRRPGTLRIGLTEVDLCLPVFSHVFGEAFVGGGVALVSTHRLDPGVHHGGDRRARKYERMVRVACHEAGHALGMTHCREPGCLMRFAGSVDVLDELTLTFCPRCRLELSVLRAQLLDKQLPCELQASGVSPRSRSRRSS